jgi:hypothetical protein
LLKLYVKFQNPRTTPRGKKRSNENIENEEEEGSEELIDLSEDIDSNLTTFACQECNFSSSSQRGLSVHIGVKHKTKSIYS